MIYFSWGLFVPVLFSLLYGITGYRAMRALGYTQKGGVTERIWMTLPVLLLLTLWCICNFPIPFLYGLVFAGKIFRLFQKGIKRNMEFFIVNLTHLMTMALHLILIGVIALIMEATMKELLQQPFWRISTCGVTLAVDSLVFSLVPRLKTPLGVIKTRSDSEEIKPFMTFLWFANFSLMIDSILCLSGNSWKLLPLFLVGSTLLLEFYLVGFLRHLYSILSVQYLEEEHYHLQRELEHQDRSASELRNKTAMEPMTGIFSRRYILEQAERLLKNRERFSVVYIDMDHLKQINDQEGHDAGDLYLIRFAREFSACLRATDIFARIGGDEFAVLLPGCMPERAMQRLEGIRRHLAGDLEPPFSFSYGIATFPEKAEEDGVSVEMVFRRADLAMYQDKQTRTR